MILAQVNELAALCEIIAGIASVDGPKQFSVTWQSQGRAFFIIQRLHVGLFCSCTLLCTVNYCIYSHARCLIIKRVWLTVYKPPYFMLAKNV